MLREEGLRFVFPDAQIGWYPGAVRDGLRLLRRQRFDAIYSSSFPITAHHRSDAQPRGPAPLGGRVSRSLERSLAARLAAPSERAAARRGNCGAGHRACDADSDLGIPFRSSYGGAKSPSSRTALITTVASPSGPTARPSPIWGTHHPARQNLAPLWQAVARHTQNASERSVRIRFIGQLPAAGRAELSAAGIGELVEETGFVLHDDALRLLTASSLLVASGETSGRCDRTGTYPRQVVQDSGTSLPILYLGSSADDAATMLNRHPGCHVVQQDDPGYPRRARRWAHRGQGPNGTWVNSAGAPVRGGWRPRRMRSASRRSAIPRGTDAQPKRPNHGALMTCQLVRSLTSSAGTHRVTSRNA